MAIDFAALFQRVLDILTAPRRTWRVIRSEPDRGKQLVTKYVLLLALIPSVCGFVGVIVFDSRFSFGDRFSFSLMSAIFKLGIFVGSVFILGWLTDAMAPSFDANRSRNNSMKLAAYSSTPVWVAGFVTLVPKLTVLAVVAGFGYAIYIYRIGAQELLDSPKENSLRFSISAVATWFVFTLVTTWIILQITGLFFAPAMILEGIGRPPAAPLY